MCTFSYICSATCTCPPAVLNVVRCCCPARRHMALACARPPCTTTLNVGGRSRPCVCRASFLEYSKVKEFMWIWPNTLNHNGWSFDQTMSVHQKSDPPGSCDRTNSREFNDSPRIQCDVAILTHHRNFPANLTNYCRLPQLSPFRYTKGRNSALWTRCRH